MLCLRLLGGFSLKLAGQERPLGRLAARAVAFLALRANRPVERRLLAGTLWPETDEERALFYLRRTLTELRGALGDEAVRLTTPTRTTLQLRLDPTECDVLAFAQGAPAAAPKLYVGPLLSGWHEDWVLSERTALEQTFLLHLERLAAQTHHPAESLPFLRQALALEPTRSSSVKALLDALERLGEHAEAQIVYRAYRQRLRDALLGEPEGELQEQMKRLKTLTLSTAPTPLQKLALPTLPTSLTRLIGRSQAFLTIEELLSQTRLLTLWGVGGMGKTRLALAVLQRLEREGEPVACAFLADLTDPAQLWGSIASALGLASARRKDSRQDVLTALGRRRMLLCLDNAEHLIAEVAERVQTLLEHCPGVRILVTSRQPLGLLGETRWAVPPLAEDDACALFVERALAVGGDALEAGESAPAQLRTLVQQLDGIPLALEMAAAHCAQLSLEEITGGLEDRFALLITGSRAASERHQTLQRTLDWSYALLGDAEKTLLRRLAIFSGGWTRAAACEVCSCTEKKLTQETLFRLLDHSLVTVERQEGKPTRYGFLETVRAYAAQKLAASGLSEREALYQRRDAYFLDWLTRCSADEALQEQANLRRVWDEARERQDGATAQTLVGRWGYFLQAQGPLLGDTDRVQETLALPYSSCESYQAALIAGANIAYAEARFREAEQWARAGVELSGEAEAFHVLGRAYQELGDYEAGAAALRQALALFQAEQKPRRVAAALQSLSMVLCSAGHNDEALQAAEEALTIGRRLGDSGLLVGFLEKVAICHFYRHDWSASERYFTQALELARAHGNEGAAASVLGGLAEVALRQGDAERSYLLSKETLACWQRLHAARGIASESFGLANAALLLGRRDEALPHYAEALRLLEAMGRRRDVAELVGWLGRAALHTGDATQGAALIHAAHEELLVIGAPTTAEHVASFLGDRPELLGSLVSAPTTLRFSEALARVKQQLA